jgi:hypothetical protein
VRAFGNCDEWQSNYILFDSDGLGAGVRGDARVINEGRRAKITVEAFHGSGAVVDKDEYMIPPGTESRGVTNGEFFTNFKAQSWWRVRELFKRTHEAVAFGQSISEDEVISINSEMKLLNKLVMELSQPTYKKSVSGKIIVDKAPNGTKSPNLADAVMMAFSQPSKKKSYSWSGF